MIKLRIATFVVSVVIAGGASAQRGPDALGKIAEALTIEGPIWRLTSLNGLDPGALAGTFRYTLADRLLTLDAGTEPVMVFEPEPAPALEGAAWKVTGFNNGRQAVVSPLPGTTLSLTFKGGTVTGFGGCNTFRAKYTATAGRVVIGPAAATRKLCMGEGVMQQEREFLAAVEAATTWTFDGRLLDMHRADGERALTAARSD